MNDNLCDLSHLDFVHERTLGASTGASWSAEQPEVTPIDDGLLFERWFLDHPLHRVGRVDTWNSYRYLLPGIFLMSTQSFPTGTAQASGSAIASSAGSSSDGACTSSPAATAGAGTRTYSASPPATP